MERLNSVITSLNQNSLIVLLFICSFVNAETLTADTTWQIGNHVFTDNVIVSAGVTLTIDAGADIRFASGKKLQKDDGGYLIIMSFILMSGNVCANCSDEFE